MRIIFMGTPEFAVASLSALIQNGFDIVAVVTAPDKPAGRGLKMHESAVKKYAVSQSIPVLQPSKLKKSEFIETLKRYKADLQIVVAFRMLPEIVWNMPPKGTINLHASLLPQYRGAAPINWAIINGEKETGVTTFKLQHEIDTGQIIDQQSIAISPDETAGDLHDKLMETGALLLVASVQKIKNGHANYIAQTNEPKTLKPAPKIFRAYCKIDWSQDVDTIYNLIRGLSPYPGAWTTINDKTMKIFAAETEKNTNPAAPQKVLTDNKNYLKVACKDGFVSLTTVQPAGKKKMEIKDFLSGFRGIQSMD